MSLDRHLETVTLGTLELRLAPHLPPNERYQDRLTPVDPSLQFLPNRRDGLVGTPNTTFWAVGEWDGGEGYDTWDPEISGFDRGINVVRKPGRKGLTLGPQQSVTVDNGGVSTFNDCRRFGYGLGSVWTCDAGSAYKWDVAASKWGAAVSTGSASPVTSLTDGDDATNMFSAHEDKMIRKWSSGSSSQHVATTVFARAPVLRSWGGRLFALDSDDLYEVDQVTIDTRTLKVDTQGRSDTYLNSNTWAYNRMSASDRGPIWLQRLDNGQTFIWQYDVNQDTGFKIGKLPVDFAHPYGIFYAFGFTFVTFRNAPSHSATGDAYLYYQRGGQRGVLGPFRSSTGTTASKPVLIAGTVGSELVIFFDGILFAYAVGEGGLFAAADTALTGTPNDAITIGPTVLVGPLTSGGNTEAVERYNRAAYTLRSASLDSGLYDMTYFDIPKMLLDITVRTDPLPANTSVQVAYSIDGAAFVTVSGTHDVDGATTRRFQVSSSSGTVIGRQIAVRLLPLTTNAANTPTIRGWMAQGIAAADERQIVMVVDLQDDGNQNPQTIIAALQAMKAAQAVVSFQTKVQRAPHYAVESFDVVVRDVITPDILRPEAPTTATIVLRAVALVTP